MRNSNHTNRNRWALLLITAAIALVLFACGGTPRINVAQEAPPEQVEPAHNARSDDPKKAAKPSLQETLQTMIDSVVSRAQANDTRKLEVFGMLNNILPPFNVYTFGGDSVVVSFRYVGQFKTEFDESLNQSDAYVWKVDEIRLSFLGKAGRTDSFTGSPGGKQYVVKDPALGEVVIPSKCVRIEINVSPADYQYFRRAPLGHSMNTWLRFVSYGVEAPEGFIFPETVNPETLDEERAKALATLWRAAVETAIAQ